MSDEPKISIITASYNYARYISQTIESVLNQSYKNWELIIVDDGSTDNSVEIIESYCAKDSRIKLFRHKNGKNKGLSKTLQLGIEKASYDWISFLESDDLYAPNNLEEKVKIIREEPEVSFIFNDFKVIDDESYGQNSHCKNFLRNLKQRVGFSSYKDDFHTINPVSSFSVVTVKKSLLKKLNWNSPIKPYLDWFLWGQLANKYEFYYLDKQLSCWRKHPGSYINRVKKLPDFCFFLKLGLYLPSIYKRKIKKLYLIIAKLHI